MDLSVLSLGLGGSAVGSIVIGIIAYFVARGFKSNCVAGGVSVAIDVHKVGTQTEVKSDEPPRAPTSDSVTIEITPHLSTPATPISHHPPGLPPHSIKTPKPKRESRAHHEG